MNLYAALLLSIAPSILASSISTSCAPPYSSQSVTTAVSASSSSCSSFSAYSEPQPLSGGASAFAAVNLSLANNPSDWSVLTTMQRVFAQEATDNSWLGPTADAHTAIDWTEALSTAGTLRNGYVQITGGDSTGYFYDAQGNIRSGIVNLDPNSPVTEISCAVNIPGCTPSAHYYTAMAPLIPVALGTNFNLMASGYIDNWANLLDGQSSGQLNSTFQFRFFELDGVTPVAVSDIPEPAAWSLLSLGLGVVLVAARRHRSNKV